MNCLTKAPANPPADPAELPPDGLAVPALTPIVLQARPEAPAAPTVRIFLATRPEHRRAERVFFYALEQVRNPERRYEIYRLSGPANDRFAIPEFAGGRGRALYHDVGQILAADPAELFDLPMADHGYLARSPSDTAVMLIDCERMARCWTLAKARRMSGKKRGAEALAEPDRWGQLVPAWHARDLEYRHGDSKLLHYAAPHLQPWRPAPERYSYRIHPYAEYFLSLEQAADAQGYEIYTAEQPTPGFAEASEQLGRMPLASPDEICRRAGASGAKGLALVGPWHEAEAGGPPILRWHPEQLRHNDLPRQDWVAATGLEHLPEEDLPWVVERLFRCARQRVLVQAGTSAKGSVRGGRTGWLALLRRVALRYPGLSWQLDGRDRQGRPYQHRAEHAQRMPGDNRQPNVWLLQGRHAGDNAQLLQVAEALGWPYEVKPFAAQADALEAPWPDLVLSVGKRTASLAREIRHRSGGHSRLVVLGRPCAPLRHFDLLLTTPQYGLPLRDNVVDLPAPFATERLLDAATLERWRQRFAHLPRPWVALLAGGNSIPYRFDATTAETLGRQASAAVGAQGGSLLVSTSRRTSPAATDALLGAVDVPMWGYRLDSAEENPYPALLALADAFIVTGESVSMLTEAALTGRPLAVFPLPVHHTLPHRLLHALERALGLVDRTAGSRDRPRPQGMAARLYDRVIEAGWFNLERRIGEVHLALGLSFLEEGLDRSPGLTPAQLAASRSRALRAIRTLMERQR